MITIELDISTILVAAVSSLVSITGSAWVTWFFSKRRYIASPPPVSLDPEDEAIIRHNRDGYLFILSLAVLFALVIVIAMLTGNCERPPTEESDVNQPVPTPRSLNIR